MGVGWGGNGHGSNCLCGNAEPPPGKILKDDPECDADPCSGNKTERCGGNWRTQVYRVACAPSPPPTLNKKDIWIPPGLWLPFNASAFIDGGRYGKLLQGLEYKLSEIPLFARAGSVVPMQTLQSNNTVVWVIFPSPVGTGRSGTLYLDDGTTTAYKTGQAISWTNVTSQTKKNGSLLITISAEGDTEVAPKRRDVLQLRRVPGSIAPQKVECDGHILKHLEHPDGLSDVTDGWEVGWWVAANATGMRVTAGSVIVLLPQLQVHGSAATVTVTVTV